MRWGAIGNDLTSVVNFGALSGFLLLHASVISLFWVRLRSMILGLSWLGVGLAYGAILAKRHRVGLEL